MRDPSPAALICAVLTGLLGLAHVFRPWDSKSPLRKWKSCAGTTRRNLLLLAFYFTAYFVAILVLFFEVSSNLAPQLLFKLSWLNGLCIEAAFLQRTFSIPEDIRGSLILRILVLLIAATAGSLQITGFAISNAIVGRYLAFAGARLFHVSAAAFFIFHFKYEIARHRKLVFFALAYTFAAVSGFCFIPISDGDIFLLVNCILECAVNVILLASARIKPHKDEDGNTAARLRDEGSFSARLGLENNSLNNTERDTAGNAGRRSLRIEVAQTVTVSIEKYGLLTPPPSPVPTERFISHSDSTPLCLDSETCKTPQIREIPETCSVEERTSYYGVTLTSARSQADTECWKQIREIFIIRKSIGGVTVEALVERSSMEEQTELEVTAVDWRALQSWGLRVKELVGESAYELAAKLSGLKGDNGRFIIFVGRDIREIFPSC